MVLGKQVKDCWEKKGGWENEKGENGFLPSYFLILINDNHQLQCVSHLYKPSRDWRKALSNGVKTHLFTLKTSKIKLWGKNDSSERGGK